MIPDVSILIAAYNAQDTIGAAIDSALKQRGVSVEVVVCDDASGDATRRIVSERAFIEPRLRSMAHMDNRGQAEALNTAARAASGRYFIQLDADDTLAPDALRSLVDVLDAQPGCGFAYGASWVKSQVEGVRSYIYSPPNVVLRSDFHRANASFYCVLYRREAFQLGARYRNVLDDVPGALQDWDFLLQLIDVLKWEARVLPDHLVLEYNFRPGTLYHRMKTREKDVLAAFKARWPDVTAEGI